MDTLNRALTALFSPEILWLIGTAIGAGIVGAVLARRRK